MKSVTNKCNLSSINFLKLKRREQNCLIRKVILRNVTHLEPQFEHSKVESNEQHALNIYGFDESANKMTMLGQIERQRQNFDLLIKLIRQLI